MINKLKISGFDCDLIQVDNSDTLTYMIYPGLEPISSEWLQKLSKDHNVSIAVIYIPAGDWNNILTPWPEPGEVKGFEPFDGQASKFLETLQQKILPEIEKHISTSSNYQSDLIGVSLSGLFTLWQWILCDTFRNIASLSGSFWYPGFIEWMEKQYVPVKKGKAFFLLGDEEPKAHIKAYRTVGVNTEKMVEKLRQAGINVEFQWVPGNHFSDPMHRAELAFNWLYSS